jgi:hypothetical protein
MIPLPVLEEIIDRSGIAPRIELLLPVGVRARQLLVRTLLLGMLTVLADHRPAHLMGIWQVTALGDGALEPYGQIAGPCLARFMSLAIQVPDTSTKMDGIWLVPGTRSAHQGMTPRVRSGSRHRLCRRRWSATRRAASPGNAVCPGMGGRGLSHPQEQPLTSAGSREPWPGPGPAGSRGHERPIGWWCPRALPLGSARVPHGLDQHEQHQRL